MSKGYTEIRYGETETNPLRRLRAYFLLSSFKGSNEDIYRAVHHFKDNKFFFANYSRDFFYKIDALLKDKLIIEVRRLLVCTDDDELNSEESRRIIAFHSTNSGYAYKVIYLKYYKEMLSEHGLHPFVDFGVFGKKRVYRARTDQQDFVIGTWSRKKGEITKYSDFFEGCWECPHSFTVDPKDIESLSVDALFKG